MIRKQSNTATVDRSYFKIEIYAVIYSQQTYNSFYFIYLFLYVKTLLYIYYMHPYLHHSFSTAHVRTKRRQTTCYAIQFIYHMCYVKFGIICP